MGWPVLGGSMWGNAKKPETPQVAQPEPKNFATNPLPKSAPATWEGNTAMSTDAMRPLGATGDRATARLGSSLHVKGEITGSEDLLVDGSVEGWQIAVIPDFEISGNPRHSRSN